MTTSKEPIKLRRRVMPTGNTSLYLDIYINGTRSYEYLKLYLVPEKTRLDKAKNRETLQLAEAVRAQRVVELQNGRFGFEQRRLADVLFWDYIEALAAEKKRASPSGRGGNWPALLAHLRNYEHRENLTLGDISTHWVEGFRRHLEESAGQRLAGARSHTTAGRLAENTKASYFAKLATFLRQAVQDGLITRNPMDGVRRFGLEDSRREYLTIEEVQLLARTPCKHQRTKEAFLFACLTGLRWSDITGLRWGNAHEQGGFTRIIFRQQKTGGQEYLDITAEAAALMGQRGEAESLVFAGLHTPSATNKVLKRWAKEAGIGKNISFHVGRHTFATLMLDLGTDLYTVSKLLGHRQITTTQIYAKIMDKNKQEAVARIPSIFKN